MHFFDCKISPDSNVVKSEAVEPFQNLLNTEPMATTSERCVRQIVEMPGNSEGNDYIVTDLHGDHHVLMLVVKKLTEHDRLFIGGDVVDRCPFSLQSIRYIVAQNQNRGIGQEQIFTVRGNHEDAALETINFLEVIEAISERQNSPAQWNQFKQTAPNAWLQFCSDEMLNHMLKQFSILSDFVNLHPWENSEEFKIRALSLKDAYANPFLRDERFWNFFCDACIRICNGGGWLFCLKKDEREEVKAFIASLPYMIRIGAVDNHSKIIPCFDIVHALPLKESAIQAVLREERVLTEKEILRMTKERFQENNLYTILSDERDKNSILTLVGHSPFGMFKSFFRYHKNNILNLDIATYSVGGILLVNYTKGSVEYVGQAFPNEDGYVIGSIITMIHNSLQKHLNPTPVEESIPHNDSPALFVETSVSQDCCMPFKWY